jgi:hypothetical protein
MGPKFGKVFASWVAFMLRKTILGIEAIPLKHDAVALDLGNDTRRRDAEADPITANQRGLGARKIANGQPIDKGVSGTRRELFNHGAHTRVGGAENIEAIDFLRGDGNRCPTNVAIFCDLGIETIAGLGGEFFGVIKATENEMRGQNDCGYDYRASERSATSFIYARDVLDAQTG